MIPFYTRILRAVYNRVVEEEVVENRNSFRHVYTGVDKTVKQALPLPVIKKIKALDLSLAPSLDYARDMFMMSFMLKGMSFIDMAYLRKTDLANGYVIYRRLRPGNNSRLNGQRRCNAYSTNIPKTPPTTFCPSSGIPARTSGVPTAMQATISTTT